MMKLTLLTPTLYRLGAGLLALLSLCACWLQFQDYLVEIQSVCEEEERKKKASTEKSMPLCLSCLLVWWLTGFCLSFIGKRGRSWWPGDMVGVIWSSLKILYSTIWVALRF
jgi:hypothetical protein